MQTMSTYGYSVHRLVHEREALLVGQGHVLDDQGDHLIRQLLEVDHGGRVTNERV